MIRLVIVDDHDLVREGIRALLEQDPIFQVVGETGDGQEAIRLATRLRPDVLLMDVSLPGGIGGLEATEAIVADCPGVKVIILTQYEHREYIQRAIRIGARGYLLKRSVAAQLKDAIKTVHLGQRYLHDFEGEPLRPLAERREKHAPVRDVAGMLRSIDYAAVSAQARSGQVGIDAGDDGTLAAWGGVWKEAARRVFLDAYGVAAPGASFVPSADERFMQAVAVFELEKAAYEIVDEASDRPERIEIPARGLLEAAARLGRSRPQARPA